VSELLDKIQELEETSDRYDMVLNKVREDLSEFITGYDYDLERGTSYKLSESPEHRIIIIRRLLHFCRE